MTDKRKAAFVCLTHVKYGQGANVKVSVNNSHGEFQPSKDKALQPIVQKSGQPEMNGTLYETCFIQQRLQRLTCLNIYVFCNFIFFF